MTPLHPVTCHLTRFSSAGTPWNGDGMGLVGKKFFARQETTERQIRQQLRKQHAVRARTALKSTAHKLRVSDPVWVLRPQPMGTQGIKTWFTPQEVVRTIGKDTYHIKVDPRQFREWHESQPCAREPDISGRHGSLDFTANEAGSDDDYVKHNNYTVEKILAQPPNDPAPAGVEFKVHWRGYRPMTPGNPSLPLCRGSTPPFWTMSASTRLSSRVSDLKTLTRTIEAMGD